VSVETVRYEFQRGLNLDDLETTMQEEKDTYYNYARNNHVPLYLQTSHSVWLENRPDRMKLHHRLLPKFRRDAREAVFMMSVGQLHLSIAYALASEPLFVSPPQCQREPKSCPFVLQ
jgi:hypothetical protein